VPFCLCGREPRHRDSRLGFHGLLLLVFREHHRLRGANADSYADADADSNSDSYANIYPHAYANSYPPTGITA